MDDLAMVLGITFVVLLAALMLAATYFFVKRGRSQPRLGATYSSAAQGALQRALICPLVIDSCAWDSWSMTTHATPSPATSLATRKWMLAAAVVLVVASPYCWEFARPFGVVALVAAVLAGLEAASAPRGRVGSPVWAVGLVALVTLGAVLALLSMTLF